MKAIVPANWNIPNQMRERFGDTVGRQRTMFSDGHLLLVLHDPPAPNERQRSGRLFWRNPEGAWASNGTYQGNQSLRKHVAAFAERAERIENRLQNAAGADDYFQILQIAAPLHRTSRNLHATLQQARDTVPDDRDIIAARDAAGDLERLLELLHMDAKNGLDYTIASRAELQSQRTFEMAVSAHRLNLLAALFFPVTAFSAIFGMNVSNGLEALPGKWLFWAILAAGFISGILLTLLIAKKPGSQTQNIAKPTNKLSENRKQAVKAAKTASTLVGAQFR